MEKNFSLKIENNVVVGFLGESKIIEIPEGVTSIADEAFKNCDFIEEVCFNSSVLKKIGIGAFQNCSNLRVVEIETLSGGIEAQAFENCSMLKHIIIPEGAMKLGDFCFYGCSEMLFAVVPSSICVLGKNVFDRDNKSFVILGEFNSSAEEYSKNNCLTFRGDSFLIRKQFLELENKNDGDRYKDFEIYEETIRCYKSVLIYQEFLDLFKDIQTNFNMSVRRFVPKSIKKFKESDFDYLTKLPSRYLEKVEYFLQKHGIYISEDVYNSKTAEYFLNYLTICKTLSETYINVLNAIKNQKSDLEQSLIDEAESKITGLSYGVIGDSLTLVTYAIDEYREEKRQRKQAYAEANAKMQSGTNQIFDSAQKYYTNFLVNTIYPEFEKSIYYICCRLQDMTKRELIDGNVIETEVFNSCDFVQSEKLVKKAYANERIDQKYAIATAIKLYPLNIDAYFFNDKLDKELYPLIEYLELYKYSLFADRFSSSFNYYDACIYLEENERIMSKGLLNLIKSVILKKEKELVAQAYTGVIDDKTWQMLLKNYYSIHPEELRSLGIDKETVKKGVSQNDIKFAEKYNDAVKQMANAHTATDYKAPLNAFRTLNDYKDSKERAQICQRNFSFEKTFFEKHPEEDKKIKNLFAKADSIDKKSRNNIIILISIVVLSCLSAYLIYSGNIFWIRVPKSLYEFKIDVFSLPEIFLWIFIGIVVICGVLIFVKGRKKAKELAILYQNDAKLYKFNLLNENVPFSEIKYSTEINKINLKQHTELYEKFKKSKKHNLVIFISVLMAFVLSITITFVVFPIYNYNKAKEAEINGDVRYAYSYYNKSLTIPNARNHAKDIISDIHLTELQNAKIGDTVKFGTYYSEHKLFSGVNEIEWKVLDKADGKILLISKYVIDEQPYDKNNEYCEHWETSSLRSWLNSTFINEAFSETEQSKISVTGVTEKDDNQHTTQDKIFIFSFSEFERYFKSEGTRKPVCTDYADNRRGWWPSDIINDLWLRTTEASTRAKNSYINSDGEVQDYGSHNRSYGIRPVMWVEVEN